MALISEKVKQFCGSAIAASYLANEWVKGKAKEEVMSIKNAQVPEIAKHLSLPPVKLHCSMLPEDATKAALNDYKDTEQTFFFHISPSCMRQAMHPLQKFATRETRTILSNKLLEAVQMGTKSTVKALSSFPLLLYRCVSSFFMPSPNPTNQIDGSHISGLKKIQNNNI
ncbi:hypothetical protein DY000_02027049 [Brassica cretica]|uniref:NIF system FeS cluster assembly NifU N-terminal domain-containing protein n=1 Tax=Brassica cretica TaxID=69181 RepID=A0ABQ7E4M9_BRACR|nr:hypothetical protein DY000_02027049 [Brassica cretica]